MHFALPESTAFNHRIAKQSFYENLVRNIHAAAQPVLNAATAWREDLSLPENIVRDTERARIEKRIAALEAKIRREKQLNRKMELNAEMKRLKIEAARCD